MSDLISRQAAIEAIKKIPIYVTLDFGETCRKMPVVSPEATLYAIQNLPSAQPERKRGKWIDYDSDSDGYDEIRCSVCGKRFTVDAERWCDIGFVVSDLNFCPNCGSDMRGEEDVDNE